MTAAAIPAALDRFRQVWAVDFEFLAPPGGLPTPICCVARELRSGREIRRWGDELRHPLPIHDDDLYVAYNVTAEFLCHLVLGWPLPRQVLDLMVEYRCYTNGRRSLLEDKKTSLLSALSFFGLTHLDPETKRSWIARILAGPPYSDDERLGILDYCASDVEALQQLLPPLASRLQTRPHWIDHALLRGRYMKAATHMEFVGVPIDMSAFRRLSTHWEDVQQALIDSIRAEYPVFAGTTIRQSLFEQWLIEKGIPWPRTETGLLATDSRTMKDMESAFPIVAPIREVTGRLSAMRLADLAVGPDGRNRASFNPFSTKTGRNAPSASRFIFGPSVWIRSLIKPAPGRAIAYIDFASQEIGIAAALSGDQALIDTYSSGDPYMSFAIAADLAPPGATKATHKAARDRCKVMMLGTNYGMGERSLSAKLGGPTSDARELVRAHRRAYTDFWAWVQRMSDTAMLRGWIDTVFGWRLHITHETRPTSLQNHPMQANGAEMLRLACCYLTEAGIAVCAPVHDAVLIEAADTEIDEKVAQARALMEKASRDVLGGLTIRTDVDIVRYPDRYADERGEAMWANVMRLLGEIEAGMKVAA